MTSIKHLQDIAAILRRDSLIMTSEAKSGHPTSCLSAAEILSALFFDSMQYDTKNSNNENNDEFILSKGHASPILYSALFHAGVIKNNLLNLRKINSPLEGHPSPNSLPQLKIATGSLGQGLSVGLGFALAAKLSKRTYYTYVLLGDSEMAEGSNYETIQLASHYKLNNLIGIIDANRFGQQGKTMLSKDIRSYSKIIKSFGWHTIIINGHNIRQILRAIKNAKSQKHKPTMIIAKTFKGRGVSFLENKENWHGNVLSKNLLEKALSELPNPTFPKIKILNPKSIKPKIRKSKLNLPSYPLGSEVNTRVAYGKALAALAISDSRVLAVDAEVSDSTHSDYVKISAPSQFIQTYIAEQDMIGISLGLSKKGYKPYASTFSSFLSRAHDQLRMSAISLASFNVSGAHSGIATGEDGAPQMGLEDIAIFQDLPNSTVLYPSDANSCITLMKNSKDLKGITYIRTTRPKTPVLYKKDEKFLIPGFKVLRQSKKDSAVLIGAGITLHESIRAYALLKKKNKNVAVIDLYCIKPLNEKSLLKFIKSHGSKVIVVEDHHKTGGIGEAIAEAIAQDKTKEKIQFSHLYVSGIPHSGTKDQLLAKHKINFSHIANAVNSK